jgi:ribonuclease HI
MSDDDLAQVTRLEQLLLDPVLRADRAQVEALLHPDFLEHGASGRMWTRDAMVAALVDNPAVAGTGADFIAVELAPDVVLLTYRVLGHAGSLRSSVWVRDPDAGWRVRFHQGTRSTDGRLVPRPRQGI